MKRKRRENEEQLGNYDNFSLFYTQTTHIYLHAQREQKEDVERLENEKLNFHGVKMRRCQ